MGNLCDLFSVYNKHPVTSRTPLHGCYPVTETSDQPTTPLHQPALHYASFSSLVMVQRMEQCKGHGQLYCCAFSEVWCISFFGFYYCSNQHFPSNQYIAGFLFLDKLRTSLNIIASEFPEKQWLRHWRSFWVSVSSLTLFLLLNLQCAYWHCSVEHRRANLWWGHGKSWTKDLPSTILSSLLFEGTNI